MKVFFYGLFMDSDLLAAEGIDTGEPALGYVEDYRLLIGERATLQRDDNARAFGVVFDIDSEALEKLYAQPGVADYVAEQVTVRFDDGTRLQALCYTLPEAPTGAVNRRYAAALLKLATRLGLPEACLRQIGRFAEPD